MLVEDACARVLAVFKGPAVPHYIPPLNHPPQVTHLQFRIIINFSSSTHVRSSNMFQPFEGEGAYWGCFDLIFGNILALDFGEDIPRSRNYSGKNTRE